MAHIRNGGAARIWWNYKMHNTEQKTCPICGFTKPEHAIGCKIESPHASDCAYWVGEPCNCVTGGSHDRKLGL